MRVIYLIQGDCSSKLYEIPDCSDFLYLQWQSDFIPMENSFHFPQSTWASGRNELYRRARLRGTYDYYVFLDDDLSFDYKIHRKKILKRIRGLVKRLHLASALRLARCYLSGLKIRSLLLEFEQLLSDNGSLVAFPRYFDHEWNGDNSFCEVDAVLYADPCMVAVHHSVADTLLPYSTEFDSQNWWTSGLLFCERAAKLYWGRVHRFSNLFIWNLSSRDYPRQGDGLINPNNQYGTAIQKPLRQVVYTSCNEPKLDETSSVVVTSISASAAPLHIIGEKSNRLKFPFVVIGDVKSPDEFNIAGCDYWSMNRQKEMAFRLAKELPKNSYSRKNLGYLSVLENSETKFLVETDDDNIPLGDFWNSRTLIHHVDSVSESGWVNAYKYFTKQHVWPRGFPLEYIADQLDHNPVRQQGSNHNLQHSAKNQRRKCYIQQGLVQHDPDVDAIFRLTQPAPVWFRERKPVYLEPGTWCPINSQNTTWSVDVAAIMYLPSFCPMRETDIWRGILAQRILWTLGAGVMFHPATLIQDRNYHNLQQDFREEIRLYTRMNEVTNTLAALDLTPGEGALGVNLLRCYKEMIGLEIFPKKELELVECWLEDLAVFGR